MQNHFFAELLFSGKKESCFYYYIIILIFYCFIYFKYTLFYLNELETWASGFTFYRINILMLRIFVKLLLTFIYKDYIFDF